MIIYIISTCGRKSFSFICIVGCGQTAGVFIKALNSTSIKVYNQLLWNKQLHSVNLTSHRHIPLHRRIKLRIYNLLNRTVNKLEFAF